jgi:hypothetical protein
VAARIRSIEKSSELIGNRTRDLPACSVVSQSTTLPRAPGALRVKVKKGTAVLVTGRGGP